MFQAKLPENKSKDCNYRLKTIKENSDSSKLDISVRPMSEKITRLPCEKVSPSVRLNPEIARTFSMLPPAISNMCMPLSTPYPLSARCSMVGTTTAGETAAWTNLNIQYLYVNDCL